MATIKVGTRPNWIALGEGTVWVENTGDGTVMKIDPAMNEVVGTFDVGRAPVYMAVVDGRLWVANGGERSVSVLDEATGDEVTRIGFETGVHGLGAADSSVWVLDLHGPRVLDNLKGTTIWRFDPATVTP